MLRVGADALPDLKGVSLELGDCPARLAFASAHAGDALTIMYR